MLPLIVKVGSEKLKLSLPPTSRHLPNMVILDLSTTSNILGRSFRLPCTLNGSTKYREGITFLIFFTNFVTKSRKSASWTGLRFLNSSKNFNNIHLLSLLIVVSPTCEKSANEIKE